MIKIQHDVATDEISEIVYTKEEIAAVDADKLRFAKIAEENKKRFDAIEAKKQEVLAKLGLTSDEVAALLA